jgi:hypothetical protein
MYLSLVRYDVVHWILRPIIHVDLGNFELRGEHQLHDLHRDGEICYLEDIVNGCGVLVFDRLGDLLIINLQIIYLGHLTVSIGAPIV